MRILKNKKGQSLIEYMVIVALMAIGTMGVMRILSQTTSARIGNIVQTLQGGQNTTNISPERVEDSHVRKKDMADFMRGARSQRRR